MHATDHMHTRRELVALLKQRQLHLTKRLGQHYLVDPSMTRRVVELCALPAGATVVEIGAGLGALTDLLAARSRRVIAVEIDHGVAGLLRERMSSLTNVEIVEQDILEFPWAEHSGCAVVGAIPYHITSPILVQLAEQAPHIAGVWIGTQRELADRLAARPGTKAYGRLSVLAQYGFVVKPLLRMPRTVFFPEPDVDSMWLQLIPHAQPPVASADKALFFDVVRAAFSQRRKMLANCLLQVERVQLDRDAALRAMERAGIAPRARGEELDLKAFAALTEAVADCAL